MCYTLLVSMLISSVYNLQLRVLVFYHFLFGNGIMNFTNGLKLYD